MSVDHEISEARFGAARLMSGEVGLPNWGRRVGKSSFRQQIGDWVIWSAIFCPRVSLIVEYHRGLCALKSPRQMVFGIEKSFDRSGVFFIAELVGGM